jgi:hypothetical protein
MTIEDGNQESENQEESGVATKTQAPSQPAINEDRIVQKLFDRFEAARNRPATQQEQNELVSIYKDLKDAGMDDSFIASQLGTAQRIKTAVMQEVTKVVATQAQDTRNNTAYEFIGSVIREYGQEDKRINALEREIRERVATKYNANPERLAEWNRNIVNRKEVEKIVDDVIGDLSKEVLGIDKPKTGPAVKTKTSGTAKSDTESGDSKQPVDVSGLNEDQEEYYNTRVTNIMRWQNKPRAEAEKLAFEQAKALPKYNPRAFH